MEGGSTTAATCMFSAGKFTPLDGVASSKAQPPNGRPRKLLDTLGSPVVRAARRKDPSPPLRRKRLSSQKVASSPATETEGVLTRSRKKPRGRRSARRNPKLSPQRGIGFLSENAPAKMQIDQARLRRDAKPSSDTHTLDDLLDDAMTDYLEPYRPIVENANSFNKASREKDARSRDVVRPAEGPILRLSGAASLPFSGSRSPSLSPSSPHAVAAKPALYRSPVRECAPCPTASPSWWRGAETWTEDEALARAIALSQEDVGAVPDWIDASLVSPETAEAQRRRVEKEARLAVERGHAQKVAGDKRRRTEKYAAERRRAQQVAERRRREKEARLAAERKHAQQVAAEEERRRRDKDLETLKDRLAFQKRPAGSFLLVKDAVCEAKYYGRYQDVCIAEVLPNGEFMVELTDYGVQVQVPRADIREKPPAHAPPSPVQLPQSSPSPPSSKSSTKEAARVQQANAAAREAEERAVAAERDVAQMRALVEKFEAEKKAFQEREAIVQRQQVAMAQDAQARLERAEEAVQAAQNARDCIVCYEPQDKLILFLPCRHQQCCAVCAPQLDACPMCRQAIRQKIDPYLN